MHASIGPVHHTFIWSLTASMPSCPIGLNQMEPGTPRTIQSELPDVFHCKPRSSSSIQAHACMLTCMLMDIKLCSAQIHPFGLHENGNTWQWSEEPNFNMGSWGVQFWPENKTNQSLFVVNYAVDLTCSCESRDSKEHYCGFLGEHNKNLSLFWPCEISKQCQKLKCCFHKHCRAHNSTFTS